MSNTINLKVKIPFGKLNTVIKWTEVNCKNDWSIKNILSDEEQEYEFIFSNDQDALCFELKWG